MKKKKKKKKSTKYTPNSVATGNTTHKLEKGISINNEKID